MGQNHSQHEARDNIRVAFFINVGFTCLELICGIFTNSIAIVSDALHDLGDSFSLGLAWYLERKASSKKHSQKFTFGYARFRLLGALVNALVLIGGSVYIMIEAVARFQNPEPVKSLWMMGFAILGVAANGYAAWRMRGANSLNEKVISWHLLEDVLGWVAVFIISIVLQFKDWYFLDPALSIGVTMFILFGVGGRLWETVHLLLQGVPADLSVNEIETQLQNVDHVLSMHHTHVWSLDGKHHVLTTHLILKNISDYKEIDKVRNAAIDAIQEFSFSHITIQIELENETRGLCND